MKLLLHKIKWAFATQQPPKGTHIIVGLGNPGKMYEQTRHNAGQAFVKHLAKNFNVQLKEGPYGYVGSFQHIILFNPI